MNNEKSSWLDRPIHPALPAVTNEVLVFAGVILLALLTRFYDLGTRVMSHDESLHTYFSWLLYRGQGYQHSPMMHGPFQFHLIALIYFLFGVSDYTARIGAVLFSIASVWMVWYWRRYLGRWGALIAGLLMIISPYMLYYGRYVRNESYAGFSGILTLYAMLRYLEGSHKRYLYLVTAATVLHFTAKETSFIYAAQAMLYLGIYFIAQVTRQPWESKINLYRGFIVALAAAVLLAALGGGIGFASRGAGIISGSETAAPANPTGTTSPLAPPGEGMSPASILLVASVLVLIVAAGLLIRGYGWEQIRSERSFGLLILIGTFVLPMLTPFPIKWLEKPLNVTIPTTAPEIQALASNPTALWVIALFVILFFAISIIIGLMWSRDWWKYAALFWGIFTVLYTTVFTNGPGFFTGLIGSLGYWLVQQGVERGSQPPYYYLLVQIPMYEYLPAIGVLAAMVLGGRKLITGKSDEVTASSAPPMLATQTVSQSESEVDSGAVKPIEVNFGTTFGLLVWWSLASIAAFTYAGERMPWLTYHLAWPMILLTGWALGQMIESIAARWSGAQIWRVMLTILLLIIVILGAFNSLRALYGPTAPFQGKSLEQLQAIGAFILPLLATLFAAGLLIYLTREDLPSLGMIGCALLAVLTLGSSVLNWAQLASDAGQAEQVSSSLLWVRLLISLVVLLGSFVAAVYLLRLPRVSPLVNVAVLTFFGLLAVQTARTSFRAAYINYDDATEYLVYAHAATGVKEVMAQVEEISQRTAGDLNAVVAYDASAPDTGVSWPVVWYLRDYTNQRSFDQPTRSLREAVAVIVDQKNFDKIDPALGNGYYRFDYIRMWWPNQDYFNLDKTRILNAILNPEIRAGIFDIWFDRDYKRYAAAVGSSTMTLTTWQPADQMRLYIKKDVAAQVWNYGVGPVEAPAVLDPYAAGTIILAADQIFGGERFPPAGLNAPRGIAFGLNADLYVADSRNHRVLHLASDGSLLHSWGTFGNWETGNAPIGTFNEPWGIAVGLDGSVYVSDTWNHRIQKFTRDGRPVKMWGQYGQPIAGQPETNAFFWGPRGLAVDSQGRLLVADTGNKRITVFAADGNFITQFGTGGFDPGQFDEPVGVAVANDGTVFVTDTWNQRIQSFTPSEDGLTYLPLAQWDVNAWIGQSLDNKPFIAVNSQKHVFVTDPEGYRVIEFTDGGQFVRTWGDFGDAPQEIGLASGIAIDSLGHVWVTDVGNNRILRYTLP